MGATSRYQDPAGGPVGLMSYGDWIGRKHLIQRIISTAPNQIYSRSMCGMC
jgi:hypothetical protein